MSSIVKYVKSSLYTDGASQQPPKTTGPQAQTQAPFPDPQNLEDFLVDLQWLEDEVSHIPITLAPKEASLVQRRGLVNICDDLLRAIALIRGICQHDSYQAWKAFVPRIIEAVPAIRRDGMHAMLRDPTQWGAVVRDVYRDFRVILQDIGYRDAADWLDNERSKRGGQISNTSHTSDSTVSTLPPAARPIL